MSEHHGPSLTESDLRRFGDHEKRYSLIALIVGVVGLVIAVLWAAILGTDGRGGSRFAYAYLTAFVFVMSIGVGALAFLLLTYLFRGGWHIIFRRIPEVLAANLALVAVLSLPILGFVIVDNGMLYSWAQHIDNISYPTPLGTQAPQIYGGAEHVEHLNTPAEQHHNTTAPVEKHDPHAVADTSNFEITPVQATHSDVSTQAHHPTPEASHTADGHGGEHAAHSGGHHGPPQMMINKRPWLNIPFFCFRVVIYMIILAAMGLFFWRNSIRQDSTADPEATRRAQVLSAPGTLLFGLTITYMTFDLIMSLDWTWYSTILGAYYFAGSMIAGLAVTILLCMRLESLGFLESITKEHYHDLGKLLFGFVFFWGYIAYSQYMLIWYASLPATTQWFVMRGATTVPEMMSAWTWVSLLLLFGHLLIPFAALISRHVKRRRAALAFCAGWLLVMHYIDMWWLIMPQFEHTWLPIGPVELGCLVGLLGIFAAVGIRLLSLNSLVPLHDPRMPESLKFHNI